MNNVIVTHLQQMQSYYTSGQTVSYQYRKQQLILLKKALYKYEQEIYNALHADLNKNKEETWVTEIGFVLAEINFALRNLKKWMKPQKAPTNLLNFPGKSFILAQPKGVVLIIGPWNYPVNLLLTPLVGAIAAGCCAVLKPSEQAPATAQILQKLISDVFKEEYIKLVEGDGAEVIPNMMNHFRFDHVFYTGNKSVGTIIYQMAAKKLVPVTLELGGKSPCIVDNDADIKLAARRIAMTKFSNAGQMCVAPDYVLVHEDVKELFLKELKINIDLFYSGEKDYCKIINEKNFNRLVSLLKNGDVIHGGRYDINKLYFEPTLILNVSLEDDIMKEEIFGPLLPIISWRTDAEVYGIIQKNEHPLSLSVFTQNNNKALRWMETISFGGGCINNASWHLTNYNLPFGGCGNSGIGAYHGKYSFETFSFKKGIMKTPTWFDPSLKYPPFAGKLSLFKRIIK